MNKNHLVLIFIFFLALFLRLPYILNDQFTFVFDMGRDMLWTRDMVVLKKFYLIGPWGSLNGVFFGPGWYYFLAIPFWLSGGDPRASVIFVFLINLLTIILGFFLGKKLKDEKLGLIFAVLMASSPLMTSLATFAFHANLLPFTTLIFIWSLYKVLLKRDIYLLLAALMASLNFHLEPAAAIFTSITLLVFIFLNLRLVKNFKNLTFAIFIFIFPFIPQVIFEFRHQFIQVKALLAFLKGQNQSLGGVLPLNLRITDRFNKFLELFSGSVFKFSQKWLLIMIIFLMFLVIFATYSKKNKKIKNFIKVNLLTLFIPFLGYIFLFSPELKGWYLFGLVIPFIFLFALFLKEIINKNFITGFLLLTFLVIFNSHFLFSEFQDAGTLKIQKKIIDRIYEDAQGQPFKVFVYTPPVYEYHYQYLFWWYGKKRHGYWPEEYSYLPGKTDYVPYKEKYLAKQLQEQPSQKTEFYYLIIEPDLLTKRIEDWLSNFSEDKIISREKLAAGIILEKRQEKIKK